MRRKRERILSFVCNDHRLPKTVREYREKYKGIGVSLDLVQKIESHLLMRHYEGFMKTGRVRGRGKL